MVLPKYGSLDLFVVVVVVVVVAETHGSIENSDFLLDIVYYFLETPHNMVSALIQDIQAITGVYPSM